jgi:hypothetical protein
VQQAGSPPAARPGVEPAASLAQHHRIQLARSVPTSKWVFFAVFILTSAIVSAWLVRVYKVDRAVLLGVQYLAWAIAASTVLAAVPARDPNAPRVGSPMSLFLILFLLGTIVATLFVWLLGTRRDIGLIGPEIAALVYMTLPYFVLARVARMLSVERIVLWTCHVVLGFGLYSILADFLGLTHYEAIRGRYFGGLGDQVAWALTLPLLIYFATRRFPLAALAGAGLVLTASRAPTLTVIAAILLLIGFGRGRRFHYIAMLMILLTFGLYQAGLFSNLLNRLAETQFLANDRTVTAAIGIKTFWASPFVGNGYYSLSYLYPSTMHRIALGILPAQTSTFVQMLSDWGLIAFVPYICFVVASTIAGMALMRRSKDLADGSVINGVIAWLLAMLWANQSALWLIVGSYIGPLVFGMAGIVAGARMRLKAAAGVARGDFRPHLQSTLHSTAAGH